MLNLKTTRNAILMAAFPMILFSCSNKSESSDRSQLEVRLTDSPDPSVREVWVDIQQVQINREDSAGDAWVTLTGANPGVYNLLNFTNGRDTLLSNTEIPAGNLTQIRLVLGPNNYLILNDGSRVELTTPSAQQSGLKINVNQSLTGGMLYRLVLDFDAGRSIVRAGNSGNYILKPVLRLLSFAPSGGNISGVVAPVTVRTGVYALNGVDTVASTFTNALDGRYLFTDVPSGAYTLSYVPSDSTYTTTTRQANVTLGQTTVVDSVWLP